MQRLCDGHHVGGAGCVRLRSVAHRDPAQCVLLSPVLLARWTNGGLFLGGKCGEQTGRHGDIEVRRYQAIQLSTRFSPPLSLSLYLSVPFASETCVVVHAVVL